jgi:AcrR family transcriptional regulator
MADDAAAQPRDAGEDAPGRAGPGAAGPAGENSGGAARVWQDAAGIPEMPWRAPRKPSSRAPLTREVIVEAALRVLDAEGMDRLSMRRVGDELGAGAASIYWHVRNKDELLQLVFERVVGEAELPPPDPSRWQEQLAMLAVQMRAILTRHRDVARISLGRVPSGPAIALLTEWLFTLLKPVGIPDKVIAYLGDLFGLYVGAFTFEESLEAGPVTGPGMSGEEFVAMLKDYVMTLPADRFPHTRRAVDVIFSGDRDDRYAFGIDLMLRGLESYATTGPRRAGAGPAGTGPAGTGPPVPGRHARPG